MQSLLEILGIARAQEPHPEVRKRGYDACMAEQHENPYAQNMPEHKSWEAGQREAFDEQAMYW